MLCRSRCPNTECRVRIILILAVSIDPIRPCLSAESMHRAREEIVRDASVSFRAFSLGHFDQQGVVGIGGPEGEGSGNLLDDSVAELVIKGWFVLLEDVAFLPFPQTDLPVNAPLLGLQGTGQDADDPQVG